LKRFVRSIMLNFKLGQTVVTSTCEAFLDFDRAKIMELIWRHANLDFGKISKADKEANMRAITEGDDRIMSVYKIDEKDIYVITEHDRSVTTVLLAEDY